MIVRRTMGGHDGQPRQSTHTIFRCNKALSAHSSTWMAHENCKCACVPMCASEGLCRPLSFLLDLDTKGTSSWDSVVTA